MFKFNREKIDTEINRTLQLARTFEKLNEVKTQINQDILPAMLHLGLDSEEEGDKMLQGLQMVADEIHDYLATFQLVAERRKAEKLRFEGAQPS